MSAASSSVWWFTPAAGYHPPAGQLRVGGALHALGRAVASGE